MKAKDCVAKLVCSKISPDLLGKPPLSTIAYFPCPMQPIPCNPKPPPRPIYHRAHRATNATTDTPPPAQVSIDEIETDWTTPSSSRRGEQHHLTVPSPSAHMGPEASRLPAAGPGNIGGAIRAFKSSALASSPRADCWILYRTRVYLGYQYSRYT